MKRPKLFVRSTRTSIITGHGAIDGFYWGTTEFAEGKTLVQLSQSDAMARNLLGKSGIRFDVYDLSKGMRTKLAATLKGVKEALLVDDTKNAMPTG